MEQNPKFQPLQVARGFARWQTNQHAFPPAGEGEKQRRALYWLAPTHAWVRYGGMGRLRMEHVQGKTLEKVMLSYLKAIIVMFMLRTHVLKL